MEQDASTRSKWMALLESSNDRAALEGLGRGMEPDLLLETLAWAEQHTSDSQQRLLPVLASVPPSVFAEAFSSFSDSHIEVLKRLAAEEPVQHQLTLLLHHWTHDAEEQAKSLEQLRKQIIAHDIQRASQADYDAFKKAIDQIQANFQRGIPTVDNALAIAWNTSREDLIERFTALKESWLRYCAEVIGDAGNQMRGSSGMYEQLDTHFNLVFGDASNPRELAALEDSDPGIEALAALTLWSAQDYQEVGLLHPGKQIAEEDLVKTVQGVLEKLGLGTVGDFKTAKIFSKQALKEYVANI